MTADIPTIVVVFKTITLFIGGIVTYLAFKAYQRTESNGLGWLAVGFGTITVGALIAGIVDQLALFDTTTALIIESAMTTIGFVLIMISLYQTH